MSTLGDVMIVLVVLVGGTLAWLRWLRVMQREHYLAGSAMRFAWRWWISSPINMASGAIGLAGLILAWWIPFAALATALVVAAAPVGLSIKGRTSPLNWTRRLTFLACVSAGLSLIVTGFGVQASHGAPICAAVVFFIPVIVDLSALLLEPLEKRASQGFVEQAAARLSRVHPTVVGITGSYGKTSTKQHVATLVGGERSVVPSPRSFNNRAGLARAINENLSDGTQVFIAEMGTYGPGEIADMVSWCPPEIAVVTAIGPVHLERFGSLDVTVSAKSEIFAPASTVVLNVDDPRLAKLASSIASSKRVVRASGVRSDVDVAVLAGKDQWELYAGGDHIGSCRNLVGAQPTNVACAMGVALALGISPDAVAKRVPLIVAVENRLTTGESASGVTVIDDTFNANPAGAVAALATLAQVNGGGKRVVVTPGMIELGSQQFEENERFGERSASKADVLVIVGKTNARALRRGADKVGGCTVLSVGTRDDAVAWVRANLGARDAVLYENDFPDHYP